MKRNVWLILLFLSVLSSCRKTIEHDSLPELDSRFGLVYELKDVNHDSAFMVFSSISDTLDEMALRQRSEFLFAEYQILKAEMNYKIYRPVQNGDLVIEAYDFYDSLLSSQWVLRTNKDLAFQYARACYFKAAVEGGREESQVEAFSDYLKALWIVDGLNMKRHVFAWKKKNADYEYFTGLIYDRLAWFFYNHDAWDAAMETLELSNECFENAGSLPGISSNLDLMGDVMLAQENHDESVEYYKKADSINELLYDGYNYLNFNSLLHRGITLSTSGNKDAALDLLHKALETSQRPWMTRRLHFGLGYIHFDKLEYDSALYHYERSYPLLPRQTIKSYCRIIELANKLGDTEKAAYYGGLLADSYWDKMIQNGQKTRMVALYENYKLRSKEMRIKDVIYFTLMMVAVLALVVVFDTVFIQRRKKRHREEIAMHEQIKASLVDEIETTRKVSSKRAERIMALETELEKANGKENTLPFSERMQLLYDKPICKRVSRVTEANVKASNTYPELALSDHQLSQLVQAVDSVFPKFSARIIEQYPRLKRADVIYCCMYILGLTEAQAAALTGKTYQAVWIRSLKLHEIFGSKSDLQFILYSFLKDW